RPSGRADLPTQCPAGSTSSDGDLQRKSSEPEGERDLRWGLAPAAMPETGYPRGRRSIPQGGRRVPLRPTSGIGLRTGCASRESGAGSDAGPITFRGLPCGAGSGPALAPAPALRPPAQALRPPAQAIRRRPLSLPLPSLRPARIGATRPAPTAERIRRFGGFVIQGIRVGYSGPLRSRREGRAEMDVNYYLHREQI